MNFHSCTMLFHFVAGRFLRFRVSPWKIYESDGILSKKGRRNVVVWVRELLGGSNLWPTRKENYWVANWRNENEGRNGCGNYRGTLIPPPPFFFFFFFFPFKFPPQIQIKLFLENRKYRRRYDAQTLSKILFPIEFRRGLKREILSTWK